MKRYLTAALAAGALALAARAQFGRGSGEWSTTGADAQRSSWVRTDPKISPASLRRGGFGLAWKLKLAEAGGEAGAFSGSAALLNGYIGYRGFRSLGYVAGAAGRIYAVDTDLGRLEWQKPLGAAARVSGGCGGMTANVARAINPAFPPMPQAGRGPGRLNFAKGAVGAPDEGAVTVKEAAARDARAAAAPPPRPPNPGNLRRRPNYLHAISADGLFHSMYVSNGEEPEPALPFLPAGANAEGLVVLDDVAYAATAKGCGGAPDAVWALDLDSHQVASWRAPASGGIAGAAGPAIAPDGTVYIADISGALAALEAKSLHPKGTYDAHAGFTSSPVLFQFQGKTLVAAAASDRTLHLLDTAALDKPYAPQRIGFAAESLATWQDFSGTRWILAPSASAVTAWKLVEKDGAPELAPGWTSHEVAAPGAPVIVNGVVFVFARGGTGGALYAFDGANGQELWNSSALALARGPAGLSAAGMQVYLATRDGEFYAFGFPIEH